MPTLYVDGKPHTFEGEHRNLLEVCLSLGFDLPYFCWHPAMHSVGACRQCAVKIFKDESDTRGRIEMACMTAAKDGTRLSIDDPEAKAFRAGVIEWLMVNHPHDCPVCDEGGECHLQDMTVMAGHNYRRQRFRKRTYRNQYLGPLVAHEMNRCIQCYRCVRYYRGYAGGRDFNVFGWHDSVYFGRHREGVLESEFSGNLVEVCPTGVFTDKTLGEHYTRKWDLQSAPSVCVHCGVGCNTIPGERYGLLRRITTRYNHDVNGYFLCDRGRFGYGFVNDERRVRETLRVSGSSADGTALYAAVEEQTAIARAAELLRRGPAIGIGSPRASLESNFALRALVGADRFYWGMGEAELGRLRLAADLLKGPAPAASLYEAGVADAVLVLGADVIQEAPMLALGLRQAALEKPLMEARRRSPAIEPWDDAALREAIQQEHGPFYVAAPYATKLDALATELYRAAPADLARLGWAVAAALGAADAVPSAEVRATSALPDLPPAVRELAGRIARDLAGGERPLVVAGAALGGEECLEAAARVARALRLKGRQARLAFTAPECNSLACAFLPGRGLESAGQALALQAAGGGAAGALVVLENDLFRRIDRPSAEALLDGAAGVIALDVLANATTARAAVLLPAATFAEGSGTLVNFEGRAQRFYAVFGPGTGARDSWRWLGELAEAAGKGSRWGNLDEVIAAMAAAVPALAEVQRLAPPARFRLVGQKVPRQSHRYTGRTAMFADRTVHEPAPAPDPDSPLAFSMEGYSGEPPSPLIPRFWAPGWNSNQAINKFQIEVGGGLHGGDPGRRLLEPIAGRAGGGAPAPGGALPPAFRPREGRWWVLPAFHVFGSEELSMRSPWIAELAPAPYLGLHPGDADRLGLPETGQAVLRIGAARLELAVRRLPSLRAGLACLPVGLPGLETVPLPAWGEIAPAGEPAGGAPKEGGR